VEPADIEALLEAVGARPRRRAAREWGVLVPTAIRGDLPVHVLAAERTLGMRAFFMRGPDREHLEVYRRFLRRNLGGYLWRFALDDDGDVYLLAEVPLRALEQATVEQALGALSTLVDESYETAVRTGFDVPADVPLGPPPGESG